MARTAAGRRPPDPRKPDAIVEAADELVLGRLAFGPGPQAERQHLREAGLRVWLDEQLAPPDGDDPDCAERLAAARLRLRFDAGKAPGPEFPAVDEMRPLDALTAPIAQLWPLTDYKRPMAGPERFRPRAEVAVACLIRAVYSRWQLREVLADFWHNHFNVDASQMVQVNVALPSYDRDVIRRHALGNFRDFLEAVASSPAMLYYLNNRSSRAGAANENFARELFELHSFGREHYLNEFYNRWRDVPGALKGQPKGFIDQDVYEAARAFTGWVVEDGSGLGGADRLPATGHFTYVESWHDNYQKRVLGVEFDPFQPALADGRKVLDLIAEHPATARHLSGKLCRRLVGDGASPRLLSAAADLWWRNRRQPDQIARVVELIVLSPDFARSGGARLRRPLELAAAFVRGTGMTFTATEGLVAGLANAGQRLFGWAPPTGHPEEAAYWISANGMRQRWQLVQGLMENRWGNGTLQPAELLDGPAGTAGRAAEAIATRLLGAGNGAVGSAILAGLAVDPARALDATKPADANLLRRVIAFTAMSAEFQTC